MSWVADADVASILTMWGISPPAGLTTGTGALAVQRFESLVGGPVLAAAATHYMDAPDPDLPLYLADPWREITEIRYGAQFGESGTVLESENREYETITMAGETLIHQVRLRYPIAGRVKLSGTVGRFAVVPEYVRDAAATLVAASLASQAGGMLGGAEEIRQGAVTIKTGRGGFATWNGLNAREKQAVELAGHVAESLRLVRVF